MDSKKEELLLELNSRISKNKESIVTLLSIQNTYLSYISPLPLGFNIVTVDNGLSAYLNPANINIPD